MRNRRCIECERPLYPSEQGALCSECYFKIITDPALADPVPVMPNGSEGFERWGREGRG